jgi:formylglycine-generating enzyme required for sulfatase activity
MKQKHLIQKPRAYFKLNCQSRHKESGERGVCVDQCRRRCQLENSEYSPSFKQTDTHLVVMIGWEDAQEFYAWLTLVRCGEIKAGQKYRLPTDAEWSVAVGLGKERGNTPREKSGLKKGGYPWGNYGPPRKGAGNYFGSLKVDKFYYTSPAGSFAANKLGLHDMGGNVGEWCEDKYAPTIGKDRVLRGPCIVDLNPSS